MLQFPLDEASCQELCQQLLNGSTRLQLTCPFPEVVEKVRQATAPKGIPKDPQGARLAIEEVSHGHAASPDRQQVATLLGLPADQVPAVRLTGCPLRRGLQGELLGSCPKVPADLEAKIGYHLDTKNPSNKERVFGYVHLTTTDINRDLGLELPLGTSTSPANAHEGTHCLAHRATLAIPVLPGQVQ